MRDSVVVRPAVFPVVGSILAIAASFACGERDAGMRPWSREDVQWSREDVQSDLPIARVRESEGLRAYDWTADGNRIAYVTAEGALYVAQAPEFASMMVDAGPAAEPRWSPDGSTIAFARQDEGIFAVPKDGAQPAVNVSPVDDIWASRIYRVYRWIDASTIAYDVHLGTGSNALYELTLHRGDEGTVIERATELRQVPFPRTCGGCMVAAMRYHYAPDAQSIVADYGGMPSVAWYDRRTGEQWLVSFDSDPDGVEIRRWFVEWFQDGSFAYREAMGTSGSRGGFPPGVPQTWTLWRGDPRDRSRMLEGAWPGP